VKKIIILFLITSSIASFSQQVKLYYIMDINEVNDHLALRLESYAETFSHKLTRNNLLNERAKVRNNYFINVIETNSKSGKFFSDMVDSIPHGKIGHTECFGKPNFFIAPEIIYPDLFITIPELKLKISSEIMYQVTWQNTLNEYQSSKIILINKAIKEIKENYNVDKLSHKIIDSYQHSASHNKIIKEKAEGEYGTSTIVIISEEKLKNGKWFYELMIRNVIVFTSKADL
jgi:hypothetical protein